MWTTWSYWCDVYDMTKKHILEVKCWYQCRSCRQSALAVVCPYCYKTFACDGRGLATLHAKYCPRTYPFRLGNDEHFHGPTTQTNHLRTLSHTFMHLFCGLFERRCLSVRVWVVVGHWSYHHHHDPCTIS